MITVHWNGAAIKRPDDCFSRGRSSVRSMQDGLSNVSSIHNDIKIRMRPAKHSGICVKCISLPSYSKVSYRKFFVKACGDVSPNNGEESTSLKKGNCISSLTNNIYGFLRIPLASDSKSVKSDILILALPAAFGQAVEPLAQLMETAYVGRLGAVELASASVSVSIFNIISKLFNIPLLSVTTSYVAEDISRSNRKSALDVSCEEKCSQRISPGRESRQQLPSVSSALFLATVIGSIEALALYFGAGLFLHLMGVPSDSPMYDLARRFLSLRAIGAPAVVCSLAIQGIFRGFKDTKTPLFCVGFGNFCSIFLLPMLIHGRRMGMRGAAVATVLTQYIDTFLLLWFLSKKAILLPTKLDNLQFGGYLKSGSLLLGRTLSVTMTMTLATSMAARQGPVAVAAHQICMQVWLAFSLLSDAVALSAQALIAGSLANGCISRVKEITSSVLKAGFSIGVVLAVFLYAGLCSLAQFFTTDMEVMKIVKSLLLFVSASQPLNSLAFVFDGLHYGVSDFTYAALAMMVVGTISSLVVLYAPRRFGLPGIWCGLIIFMALRTAAGFSRLNAKTGPWAFLHQELENAE